MYRRSSSVKTGSRALGRVVAPLLIIGLVAALLFIISNRDNPASNAPDLQPEPRDEWHRQLLIPSQSTLVVYILSFADAVQLENFQFFYYEAIRRDTTAQYHILIEEGREQDPALPVLPSHALYIPHDRSCGGLSLLRWYLQDGIGRDISADNVVLLSSAVRGPFIPPGLRALVTWHAALCADLAPTRDDDPDRDQRREQEQGPGQEQGRRSAAGLIGCVMSCVQEEPPGGAPGAFSSSSSSSAPPPLQPPFPEFTALCANQAAISLLFALPPQQLPACPPAGTAAAAAGTEEEEADEAAASSPSTTPSPPSTPAATPS
ncbi:hypothetical protein Agub_g13514, partial [Astrephomene gubernaculifera]